MWDLDNKEGWAPKNWCFQIVVLEKTLKSPLDSKETKPVNPKENQPWIFMGRICAEAEAPIIWSLDVKTQLTGKDPHGGKDWEQEKRATEYEMVGWHHWFNGHELNQWTWIWANPGRQRRTGKPGMLQSMGLKTGGHNLVTEQQQQH